jgi:hypothetical protein
LWIQHVPRRRIFAMSRAYRQRSSYFVLDLKMVTLFVIGLTLSSDVTSVLSNC